MATRTRQSPHNRGCPVFSDAMVASLEGIPARVTALEQWQQAEMIADAIRRERDEVVLQRLDALKLAIDEANNNCKSDKSAAIRYLVLPLYGALASAFVVWLLSGGLTAIK